VMKEAEFGRVSSTAVANLCVCVGNAKFNAMSEPRTDGRGNALEAISRNGMKRVLKAVVEVQYTTVMLDVAR